jgi:Outer membrane protein beta-barrel domain
MTKLIALGVFCVTAASAQGISVGVLGGAPFTDVVKSTTQNNFLFIPRSDNFTVGPALRINLPVNLRFEVDALYRPYSFTIGGPAATFPAGQEISASQWRFPFLLQYRFGPPIVKPFVEAGLSFDHLANISSAAKNITSGPGQLVQQSHASFVLGGGVDLKIPFVRLSGELRYTRQGSEDFRGISNLDQAEVLFGIHF